MCGICGFVGSGDLNYLNKMLSHLQHRGPDAEGLWQSNDGVFLGHKRLSIIDIKSGKQPMISNDLSVAITFNGEIYNAPELRKFLLLKGHTFRTHHSDTEVILNGYLEWGEKIVEKLNGMWAFCLYDSSKNLLFLSRDRFGEKPLYYTYSNHRFVFASELRPIEHFPGFVSQTSNLALSKYLGHGYIPAPYSLLKGVFKLSAGTNLFFDTQSHKMRLHRYWRFNLEPDPPGSKNQGFYREGLLSHLEDSVKLRLVSDVPIGTFLSGGIDSSTISLLAKKFVPELKTFSVGFSEKSFDETRYSQEVASLIGSEHHSQVCRDSDLLEMSQELATQLDEPVADSSIIGSYLLCKFARKEVKVTLGGDGADELLAGYDPFKAIRTAQIMDKFSSSAVINNLCKSFHYLMPVSHKNMSLDFKIKRFLDGMRNPWDSRHPAWLSPLTVEEIRDVLGVKFSREEIYSEAIETWNHSPQENLLERSLNFYTNIYLQNGILAKLDRASMLNSLEVRSPFLDINFVNFVRKIPTCLKYNRGITKFILKKSVDNLLPHEIINRKKKGFGVPIGKWFKEGKLPSGIFSSRFKKYLPEHQRGQKDHRLLLWAEFLLHNRA